MYKVKKNVHNPDSMADSLVLNDLLKYAPNKFPVANKSIIQFIVLLPDKQNVSRMIIPRIDTMANVSFSADNILTFDLI